MGRTLFRFSAPPSPNIYTSYLPSGVFWVPFLTFWYLFLHFWKSAPGYSRKHNFADQSKAFLLNDITFWPPNRGCWINFSRCPFPQASQKYCFWLQWGEHFSAFRPRQAPTHTHHTCHLVSSGCLFWLFDTCCSLCCCDLLTSPDCQEATGFIRHCIWCGLRDSHQFRLLRSDRLYRVFQQMRFVWFSRAQIVKERQVL